jgi:UPF0755 protein
MIGRKLRYLGMTEHKRRNTSMNAQKTVLSAAIFLLRLAITILIIVGIYRIGAYTYAYCYSIVSDAAVEAAPGRDVSVNVTSDMSAKSVARLLEKKGLVEDATVFRLQLKANDYDDKLKPGNYILNTSMKPKEMMKILAGEEEEEEE